MTATRYERKNGPLSVLQVGRWSFFFGRCNDENHTIYSDGKIWWGAPYRRLLAVHLFGLGIGVTQGRESPPPAKGAG